MKSFIATAIAALLVSSAGTIAFATNCTCRDNCEAVCPADKHGCCGCGALSSDCICCTPGTCQAGSVFGWGYANCDGGSS